ncbi:hypothetical protein GCM10023215_47250 [Pseudonocardia yuanmonensis]|uniref:Uncharacterized protein n=1 Tax=Pseudonocardia yuanmonensis TaxID=1095914 RepID=A0ABP8X8M1_9PSEU
MRFALDGLLVDVPPAQIEESRAFYRSRPGGRGPSTPERLLVVRASRAAPAPVDPAAVDEIVEAGARPGLAMATLLRRRDRGVVDGVVGAALRFGTYDLSDRIAPPVSDGVTAGAAGGHKGVLSQRATARRPSDG